MIDPIEFLIFHEAVSLLNFSIVSDIKYGRKSKLVYAQLRRKADHCKRLRGMEYSSLSDMCFDNMLEPPLNQQLHPQVATFNSTHLAGPSNNLAGQLGNGFEQQRKLCESVVEVAPLGFHEVKREQLDSMVPDYWPDYGNFNRGADESFNQNPAHAGTETFSPSCSSVSCPSFSQTSGSINMGYSPQSGPSSGNRRFQPCHPIQFSSSVQYSFQSAPTSIVDSLASTSTFPPAGTSMLEFNACVQ